MGISKGEYKLWNSGVKYLTIWTCEKTDCPRTDWRREDAKEVRSGT